MSTSLGGPARADTRMARIEQFLDILAETGDLKAAVKASGQSLRQLAALRRKQPRFAREWDHAWALAGEMNLSAMLVRALNGQERTIALGSGKDAKSIEINDRLALEVAALIEARRAAGPPPATDPPPHPVTVETARQIIRERAAAQDARRARLAPPTAFSGDQQDGAFQGGQAP